MRLIDADVLLKEWRLECGGSCFIRKDKYCMHYDRTKGVCTLIIKAPTVEPIKHGHWIDEGLVDGNQNRYCRCSECGKGDTQAISQRVPYCWWCGAKMDEVEE